MIQALLLGLGFLLAVHTQFTHLVTVPGLHYDEAWQGLLALRISTESGFWPFSAMNSYTTPILHYVLAIAFKVFGPGLLSMRVTLGLLNLATLALVAAALWRLKQKRAAAWFALLWAMLPLSIHNHRFFIEVTSFHGFCFALVIWAAVLWKKRPKLSAALAIVGVAAGALSHILFVTIYLTGLITVARCWPREFITARFRALVASLGLLLALGAHRMASGLHSAMPRALELGLIVIALLTASALFAPGCARLWRKAGEFAAKGFGVLLVAAIPFAVFFIGFLWNGFWPYAQMTGNLDLNWLPLNAIVLIALVGLAARDERLSANPWWIAAVSLFLLSSIMIFKQTSRYYTITMIALMAWAALELARIKIKYAQPGLAALLVMFNLWAFQARYVTPFETHGAGSSEFRAWIFHDSAKDFRPYQKAFSWLNSQGCVSQIAAFESDRDALSFEFLDKTTPRSPRTCSHAGKIAQQGIANFDPRKAASDAVLTPPNPSLKLLAHFQDWGDLAYWVF